MSKSLEQLKKELQAAADRVKECEEAIRLAVQQPLTLAQRVAIVLHSQTCHHNHVDGCGWFYDVHGDVHNWSGWAHNHYLKLAEAKVARLNERLYSGYRYTDDDIVELVEIIASRMP